MTQENISKISKKFIFTAKIKKIWKFLVIVCTKMCLPRTNLCTKRCLPGTNVSTGFFPGRRVLVLRFVPSRHRLVLRFVPGRHVLVHRFVPGRHRLVLRFVPGRHVLVQTITRHFWREKNVGVEKDFFLNVPYVFCGHLPSPFHILKVFPKW